MNARCRWVSRRWLGRSCASWRTARIILRRVDAAIGRRPVRRAGTRQRPSWRRFAQCQAWRRRKSNPRNVSAVSPQAYYRRDLALVHHLGYGFHADACAPGILTLLEPVREKRGLVLELGCGSGALTRHLVEAGHRVVATDASPPMLELAREAVPGAEELRLLKLLDDPLPECDAVVSVGHVLSYLPNEGALEAALVAAANALRPGGVLAIDLLDLRYGDDLAGDETRGRVRDDWAVILRLSRDDERLENVLVETGRVPAFLATHGLDVHVAESFGDEELPPGLMAIVGNRLR